LQRQWPQRILLSPTGQSVSICDGALKNLQVEVELHNTCHTMKLFILYNKKCLIKIQIGEHNRKNRVALTRLFRTLLQYGRSLETIGFFDLSFSLMINSLSTMACQ
jgi:hypothetical protein